MQMVCEYGRKPTAETVAKIIAKNTGRKRTDEFREKMRIVSIAREAKKRLEVTV